MSGGTNKVADDLKTYTYNVFIYKIMGRNDAPRRPEGLPDHITADWILSDKETILSFIDEIPLLYRHLNEQQKNDKDIALREIAKNPGTFQQVNNALKDDRYFFLQCCEKTKYSVIQYDNKFCNDSDIMLAAIKENPQFYKFVSEELKTNDDFNINCVRANVQAYKQIESATNNRNIMLEVIRKNQNFIKEIGDGLKNRAFMLDAIEVRYDVFIELDNIYQSDADFRLEAVKKNGQVIICMREDQLTREIMLEAVKQISDKDMREYTINRLPKAYRLFLSEFCLHLNNPLNQNYIKLREECGRLFINGELDVNCLTEMLENTNKYVDGKMDKDTYTQYADQFVNSPSPILKGLGILMMAISVVAVIGLGVAAVATGGVGLIPAAGASAAALGLFSSGFMLFKANREDEKKPALSEDVQKLLASE